MSDEPKKELSTETRLLIALALMGLVLFATPYFFKNLAPPPPPAKKAAITHEQPAKPAPASSSEPPEAAPVEPTPSGQHIAGKKEEAFVVETDLYKIVFSNRGAVIREWTLKKYTDDEGKPLELVNTFAAPKTGYPFQLVFEQKKPATDLNNVLFDAKPTSDGLGITYEYADSGVSATKTFRFEKNQYVMHVAADVRQNGFVLPFLLSWRGGFGDSISDNPSDQRTLYFDISENKLKSHGAKDAKNGLVANEGNFSFAAIEDKYFTAAFRPAGGGPIKLVTFSDTVGGAPGVKEQPRTGAGFNSPRGDFEVFVGPKDVDILRNVNKTLVNIIDWGWFWFLAKPLFVALHYVSDNWVHNYGWSIVLVTVLINLLLFPFRFTNLKSMKKMQVLQPQLAAINAKYKGISLRDPRKQQQNEEVMALYKKHGANPMSGCMPMLIQIPFFYAFYKVLVVTIELRHAQWLWVTDLSQPEHLAIHVLPIIMIVTQFVMQKMTPMSPGADPSQQRMMQFMPLVFGFIFYNLPSGLVLYYMTSNLVGIAQQWFFNKTVKVEAIPVPAPVAKKHNGKRR